MDSGHDAPSPVDNEDSSHAQSGQNVTSTTSASSISLHDDEGLHAEELDYEEEMEPEVDADADQDVEHDLKEPLEQMDDDADDGDERVEDLLNEPVSAAGNHVDDDDSTGECASSDDEENDGNAPVPSASRQISLRVDRHDLDTLALSDGEGEGGDAKRVAEDKRRVDGGICWEEDEEGELEEGEDDGEEGEDDGEIGDEVAVEKHVDEELSEKNEDDVDDDVDEGEVGSDDGEIIDGDDCEEGELRDPEEPLSDEYEVDYGGELKDNFNFIGLLLYEKWNNDVFRCVFNIQEHGIIDYKSDIDLHRELFATKRNVSQDF